MNMNKLFALDTHVLIYLHDREKAIELMAMNPIISGQVVSEYINVLRRLLNLPKDKLLDEVLLWLNLTRISSINLQTIQGAKLLISKYKFQLFDSMIIASALECKCETIFSEDMHHELLVEGTLRIINPFL